MKEGWQEGREGQSQGKGTGSWPILPDAYLEEGEQTRPRLGKMWASVHTGTLREVPPR